MGADVAHAAGRAAAFGVGAPASLLLSGGFETRGQPALRILDDDFADSAELAGADHVAGFFHQRVTGVIVREAIKQAGLFHNLRELPGLGEVKGGGFVAEDVETVFQRHLRRREMNVVRRDDGDEVHAFAFGQPGLALDHLLECAVTAFRREEQVRAAGLRAFGVGGKSAADKFDQLVYGRRDTMHATSQMRRCRARHHRFARR